MLYISRHGFPNDWQTGHTDTATAARCKHVTGLKCLEILHTYACFVHIHGMQAAHGTARMCCCVLCAPANAMNMQLHIKKRTNTYAFLSFSLCFT